MNRQGQRDAVSPTVIYGQNASSLPSQSFDVSRPQVGLIDGDRPRFADDTTSLLHSRLFAAASVNAVVMIAATVGNTVAGTQRVWSPETLAVVVALVAAGLLRLQACRTQRALRLIEIAVFGSAIAILSAGLSSRLNEFADAGDAVSAASTQQHFLMAWTALIFVYGTLMPNTIRRGASVMFTMAVIPYVTIVFLRARHPTLAELLSMDRSVAVIPFPIVSAAVATFAAHVINVSRREAFKAKQFGQYRLKDHLGAGGMGDVYHAEHVLLKRPCAIKLIKADDRLNPEVISRFEREVQATAKLTHANTIDVYDFGRTDDGTFYYVMELLPGANLEEVMRLNGPLPPSRVRHLLRQVCSALEEAHERGLIHRDIKPGNIFISQRGGQWDVVKLLDFGLVRELGQDAGGVSKNGAFCGTPLYMAPEQAAAYDSVDRRADIYSVGAVAYEMLTGQPPFSGETVLELVGAHQFQDPRRPTEIVDSIPAGLEEIILKALSKEPTARFQHARDLEAALNSDFMSDHWDHQCAAQWWERVDVAPFGDLVEPQASHPGGSQS